MFRQRSTRSRAVFFQGSSLPLCCVRCCRPARLERRMSVQLSAAYAFRRRKPAQVPERALFARNRRTPYTVQQKQAAQPVSVTEWAVRPEQICPPEPDSSWLSRDDPGQLQKRRAGFLQLTREEIRRFSLRQILRRRQAGRADSGSICPKCLKTLCFTDLGVYCLRRVSCKRSAGWAPAFVL